MNPNYSLHSDPFSKAQTGHSTQPFDKLKASLRAAERGRHKEIFLHNTKIL